MFGIGGFELFIILLFAFLIFGPDKLPEMAKTLGVALNKFKQAQEEMKAVINDEVLDPDAGKKAASGSGSKPAPHATQESFAERKARYDKERAERLKRQQIDANRAAMKAEAAKKPKSSKKLRKASPKRPRRSRPIIRNLHPNPRPRQSPRRRLLPTSYSAPSR